MGWWGISSLVPVRSRSSTGNTIRHRSKKGMRLSSKLRLRSNSMRLGSPNLHDLESGTPAFSPPLPLVWRSHYHYGTTNDTRTLPLYTPIDELIRTPIRHGQIVSYMPEDDLVVMPYKSVSLCLSCIHIVALVLPFPAQHRGSSVLTGAPRSYTDQLRETIHNHATYLPSAEKSHQFNAHCS